MSDFAGNKHAVSTLRREQHDWPVAMPGSEWILQRPVGAQSSPSNPSVQCGNAEDSTWRSLVLFTSSAGDTPPRSKGRGVTNAHVLHRG